MHTKMKAANFWLISNAIKQQIFHESFGYVSLQKGLVVSPSRHRDKLMPCLFLYRILCPNFNPPKGYLWADLWLS